MLIVMMITASQCDRAKHQNAGHWQEMVNKTTGLVFCVKIAQTGTYKNQG